jgi:hypothetical protein
MAVIERVALVPLEIIVDVGCIVMLGEITGRLA